MIATKKFANGKVGVPPFPVLKFTVPEFELMIDSGIVANTDRLEFLDGWIVPKMVHNPRHDSAVFRLQMRLIKLIGEEWLVRVQSAIQLSGSLPEPDITVVPGPESHYDRARPRPKEIELLVEVSDSTLEQDRGIKKQLYATGRIQSYWVVNLVDEQIEVYSLPKAGKSPTYRSCRIYQRGESLPVVLGGKEIGSLHVADLLV